MYNYITPLMPCFVVFWFSLIVSNYATGNMFQLSLQKRGQFLGKINLQLQPRDHDCVCVCVLSIQTERETCVWFYLLLFSTTQGLTASRISTSHFPGCKWTMVTAKKKTSLSNSEQASCQSAQKWMWRDLLKLYWLVPINGWLLCFKF